MCRWWLYRSRLPCAPFAQHRYNLKKQGSWLYKAAFSFFVRFQAVQSHGILCFKAVVPASTCAGGIIHIGMIQIIWLCRGACVITGLQHSKQPYPQEVFHCTCLLVCKQVCCQQQAGPAAGKSCRLRSGFWEMADFTCPTHERRGFWGRINGVFLTFNTFQKQV